MTKRVRVIVLLCLLALSLLALVITNIPWPPRETRDDRIKREMGLEPYVDLDLRKLSSFAHDLQRLTGDTLELERWGLAPWWVSRFDSGEAAWMFIQVYPGYEIPDVSHVQVHVFDESWQRICKQSFPTGYRMFVDEAKIVTKKHLGQDVLVVKTTCAGPFMVVDGEDKRPAFEQGNWQLQYYAFHEDALVMVRLEDDKGRAVHPSGWSPPRKGPAWPERTVAEWTRRLGSNDPVEVLATLVWLSGRHLPSTKPRKVDRDQESVEDSRTFEAVKGSPHTREALMRLKGSENVWVREYAELVSALIEE